MFVEIEGGFLPLSAITRVRHGKKHDDKYLILHCENDITYEVYEGDFKTALMQVRPIIPSLSGYFVLWPPYKADFDEIGRSEIVGWYRGDYGLMEPLIFDDTVPVNYAILSPDGRVAVPCGDAFDTIADYAADCRKALEKAAASAA